VSPPPDLGFGNNVDAQGGRMTGVATGIVSANTDPDELGRVKLRLPWRSDEFETDWVRIAVPMAGKQQGVYFLPDVGDEVLVAFDNGDVRYPYVLGALWSRTDKPPEKNGDGKNAIRLIKTRAGHLLKFDDTENEGVILIQLVDGKKVRIDTDGIAIDDGANKITLDAKGGTVAIEAKASLSLKAPKIAIEASTSLDLKGGAALNAQATMVRIN